MKTNIIKFLWIACFATILMSACSENEKDEARQVPSVEEIQLKELIQYVQEIRPAPNNIQTRGWWGSFKGWFKRIGQADGGGYKWARENGGNLGTGLLVSVCSSLVTAIGGDNARIMWNFNDEWKVYERALTEYQKLGNAHNQAIYDLCRENPTLKNGNYSLDTILSLAQKKTKALGYDSTLSQIQRVELMIILQELKRTSTVAEVTSIFLDSNFAGRYEYQFLEEYLDAVTALADKEASLTFTEQIYKKIDSLSNVNKTTLKGMTSIALSSINLWTPVK